MTLTKPVSVSDWLHSPGIFRKTVYKEGENQERAADRELLQRILQPKEKMGFRE